MSCDGRKDGRLCNSKAVKSEFIDRFEKDFGVNPKRQSSIKVQGGKQRTVSRERVEKMADGVSLYKQKSLMKNRCWEKNRRIHSRAKTCDTFIKQYVEPIGNTVYQFTVRDLAGEEVSLGRYQGMPLLIVNMASNDLQYTEKNLVHLNRLYLNYHQYQFHIAAFPTNDVAREPLNEMELVDFILKNDIRYDVYAKVDVLGINSCPLFSWLRQMQNSPNAEPIKSNFNKFLIDRHGRLFRRYGTEQNVSENDIKVLLL